MSRLLSTDIHEAVNWVEVNLIIVKKAQFDTQSTNMKINLLYDAIVISKQGKNHILNMHPRAIVFEEKYE